MKDRPEFVSIGRVSKAHGIKGEVIVLPITDNVDQFRRPMEFFLSNGKQIRDRIEIEKVREQKGRIIVKLRGFDDRDKAESIRGFYIERRLESDEKLAPDEYYIFDLIGLNVFTTAGEKIGTIADVLSLPANDVYVVRNNSEEILIPAIKSIIKRVDLENELVLIEPMEGLF